MPWWEGGEVPLAAERAWRRAAYGRLRRCLFEDPRPPRELSATADLLATLAAIETA